MPDNGSYWRYELLVWDVGTATDRLRFPFDEGSSSSNQRLVFSSDGRFLLSNSERKILLYRIPED